MAWNKTGNAGAAAGDAGDRVSRLPIELRDLGSLRAYRQCLKETGYVEGENVAIVYRFAENQNDRLPELAADLVRRHHATPSNSIVVAVRYVQSRKSVGTA
jgi:hypothetical protein